MMLNLVTIASLAAVTLALPTPSSIYTRDATAPISETWDIPTLQMHMMSVDSGIPGGYWPSAYKFDSTISFNAILPSHTLRNATDSVTCQATFANGTLPVGPQACADAPDGQQVYFGMTPYEPSPQRRVEMNFYLSMYRVAEDGSYSLSGQQAITTDGGAAVDNSYLTCLLGAPFDGFRCTIKGMLSVQKELLIEASAGTLPSK